MNIPRKAVEAAVAHFKEEHLVWPHEGVQMGDYDQSAGVGTLSEVIDQVLEVAAPFIAAQALRDHATTVVTHHVDAPLAFSEGMKFAALLAMDHASHLEEEQ